MWINGGVMYYFSIEDTKKLTTIANSRQEISISGVNGIGQRFETKGFISTTDNGKPAIFNDHVAIEFGDKKDKEPDFFAFFMLNYDGGVDNSALYLLCIKNMLGEIVFENKDRTRIMVRTSQHGDELMRKLKFDRLAFIKDDPVTKELRKLLGKPVIINDKKGVLASMCGNNFHGETSFEIVNGPVVEALSVRGKSVLQTVFNDGTVETLAENQPMEYNDICLDRKFGFNIKTDDFERDF